MAGCLESAGEGRWPSYHQARVVSYFADDVRPDSSKVNLLPPEPAPCADDDRHPAVEMHVILRDRPDGSSTPPAPSSPSGRLMPVVVIGLLLLVCFSFDPADNAYAKYDQ